MNLACPYCGAPIPNRPAEHHVGGIRFDSRQCIVEWFSLPRHNRRRVTRPVGHERRAS